jgi:hypothetical protein
MKGGISTTEGEETKVVDELAATEPHIITSLIQTAAKERLYATVNPWFYIDDGSAITVHGKMKNIPGIINAFVRGGQRWHCNCADVLFAIGNPAGRLPVTFYIA